MWITCKQIRLRSPSLSIAGPRPNPWQKVTTSNYWVGQNICLGFSCCNLWKNPNKLTGRPNMMTEIQHPLEIASIESWPHLLGTRWTRKKASTTASKLQRTWGVGQLIACLESDSKIQIESEPILAQCPPHLIPLPPQQAEVQVLDHTTYQRLCISNQSSNHTLY